MYWRRVEDLRVDHDLTQQQVADFLKINRTTYRRYEKGERDLPLELAIQLSKLYNTSLDYLVGLSDKKNI